MTQKTEKPPSRWCARALAVTLLLAVAVPLGAPPTANARRRSLSKCPNPLPPVTLSAVIDATDPKKIKVNDVTIQNAGTDVVKWSCTNCPKDKWVAVFDQTPTIPFADFFYHDHGAESSGTTVITPDTTTDLCFEYTVYVGNHKVDPQVIIKATGIEHGRKM